MGVWVARAACPDGKKIIIKKKRIGPPFTKKLREETQHEAALPNAFHIIC